MTRLKRRLREIEAAALSMKLAPNFPSGRAGETQTDCHPANDNLTNSDRRLPSASDRN